MAVSSDALAVAASGLALAAVALARAGARQRSFRGWGWWVGALLAGAAGVALAAWDGRVPVAAAGAQALLLAWPVLALVGMRHFHARLGLPASERADWLVLAASLAVLALPAASGADPVSAVLLPGAAALLSHLYVAAVLAGSRRVEDLGALRLLAAVIALAALLPALRGLAAGGGAPASAGGPALAAALGMAVTAFTTLMLMSERTERELRESRRRLRVLANTDALTAVPNRRHFEELANRALAADADEPPVLLLFDIDHFKLVNDKFGHAAGDRALRLVGRCMQQALRARDLAGRLGGDEFALLLCGATLAQAVRVADRIVTQLQAQSIEHRLPCLGLSFGLVQAQPGEGVDDTLRRADQALYEAKRQGRSRAVTAHGGEDEPVFAESQRLGLTAL